MTLSISDLKFNQGIGQKVSWYSAKPAGNLLLCSFGQLCGDSCTGGFNHTTSGNHNPGGFNHNTGGSNCNPNDAVKRSENFNPDSYNLGRKNPCVLHIRIGFLRPPKIAKKEVKKGQVQSQLSSSEHRSEVQADKTGGDFNSMASSRVKAHKGSF